MRWQQWDPACVAVGYEVITTASPKNFDCVKKLGAARVFDYHSATIVEELPTKALPNHLWMRSCNKFAFCKRLVWKVLWNRKSNCRNGPLAL